MMLRHQETVTTNNVPLGAKRVFRLSLAVAVSLWLAYALATPLPYLAPIFSLVLGAQSFAALKPKALFSLLLVVVISLGLGLFLIPLLDHYAISAILIVAVGLYFSSYLTVNAGKALLGLFLTIGFTLISVAGMVDDVFALLVIKALFFGIAIAVLTQWLVYPWFGSDPLVTTEQLADNEDKHEQSLNKSQASNWIAIRATIIVLPVYIIALINPLMYIPIILKSVSLAQQSSGLQTKQAGKELLGSTFLAGFFAIILWFLLGIITNLWMYFAWVLLFGFYFIGKMLRVFASKYPPSFWQNVFITIFILLGPAVEDSANGKDVYAAFAIRMSLFIAVTIYACCAVYLLEYFREIKVRVNIQER